MAISKRGANILIVALLLVLLYALNPTSEDFRAWRSAQARTEASGDASDGFAGALKKGAGAVAGAAAGIAAAGYARKDYFLCSTYSLGRERYLGLARFFVKLR